MGTKPGTRMMGQLEREAGAISLSEWASATMWTKPGGAAAVRAWRARGVCSLQSLYRFYVRQAKRNCCAARKVKTKDPYSSDINI